MDLKSGWQTTEWWTTLAAHVIAVLALFHVAVSANLAQALTGLAAAVGPEIGAAIYTHSRSRLKAATQTNLAVTSAKAAELATNAVQQAVSDSSPPAVQAPVPPPVPASGPAVPTVV